MSVDYLGLSAARQQASSPTMTRRTRPVLARRDGPRLRRRVTLPRAACHLPASGWSHRSRAMLPLGSLTPTPAAPLRTHDATISQSESRARRTALVNDEAVG